MALPSNLTIVVGQQQILDALNVPPLAMNEEVDFLELYAASDGVLPRSQIRSMVPRLLSTKLRKYVDQWLHTGIHRDGSEVPSERKLVEYGYMAVHDYMEKYRPHIGLTERGLAITLGEPSRPSGPESLFCGTEEEAQRLFTCLIASDWKNSFAKCRYSPCGRYFVHPKIRPKYRHGMFCCRRHQALASAEACTKKLRTNADLELIGIAATRLLASGVNNDQWQSDAVRKRQLATVLSRAMARKSTLRIQRQNVRMNWVTRHQRQIEQERARRN